MKKIIIVLLIGVIGIFGCGCLGDVSDIKGADVDVYLDGVLINSYTREVPVGTLYEETIWAKDVVTLFCDSGIVESVTVIDNIISIYIVTESKSITPSPIPTPNPSQEILTPTPYPSQEILTPFPQVCTPHEIECFGNKELWQCKSDGSDYQFTESCEYGCEAGSKQCNLASTQTPTPTLISIIPIDYYNQPQYTRESTIDWLLSDWEQEYEANGWDCSMMSAYTEYYLENTKHYNSDDTIDFKIVLIPGHAFVMWENSEGMIIVYEATAAKIYTSEGNVITKSILGITQRGMFDFEKELFNSMYLSGSVDIFNDIYEIENYYMQYSNGEESFLEEWAWWC